MPTIINQGAVRTRRAVPVIADSIRRDAHSSLARCIYFVVTLDEPDNDATLQLNSQPTLPVLTLVLGLEGVLLAPIHGGEFTAATDISNLFAAVESPSISGARFAVDTEDLWLPVKYLDKARELVSAVNASGSFDAERGDLFRISIRQFEAAQRFARARSGLQSFLSDCGHLHDDVAAAHQAITFSSSETIAFRDWSTEQVNKFQEFKP